MLFEQSSTTDMHSNQRNIDQLQRQRDRLFTESALIVVRVANRLLDLRYQKDTSKMVEIAKGDEVVFRGRTGGQPPELSKLSAGDLEQLNRALRLPADSELQGYEDMTVTVNGKTVLNVTDEKLKLNKLLTPEQTRVLDTADDWVQKHGERGEDGTERYDGYYKIERTADNLLISNEGRALINAKEDLFKPEAADYKAFDEARRMLDGVGQEKKRVRPLEIGA